MLLSILKIVDATIWRLAVPETRLTTVYLISIGLAALLGVLGYFHKDPAWLLFFKILTVPVFMFASVGLDSYFPASEARYRSWLKELERHLLSGILVASFVVVVTTKQDSTLVDLTIMLALLLGSYVPITAGLFWRKHGRSKISHRNVTSL
ncbi:hypothetical protein [Rhizobium sp. FKY42]|uniref:hypothetical protein n=1 Tax=Rhizobium sp. FKY42 TaxID=2562310 RepID=UPI0010C06548|nr:hypothetical protein [Rhizobium sp. FKY42]